MKFSSQLEGAMQERRKVDPAMAFPGEDKPGKEGSFKVSSVALKVMKDAGYEEPDKALFKKARDYINGLPRNDLPKFFGLDNIPDTQDFIANKPRQAFQKWMRMSAKADPRTAKYIRRYPENTSLIFYMFMVRISGRQLADIVFKRYFETESGHPEEFKAGFERKKREAERREREHGKFRGAGI